MAAVQKVGDFTASGLIFKDSVEVLALDDEDGLTFTDASPSHKIAASRT